MIKVLFVCMGNICRSPAAEGIFKKLIKVENLENKISTDSAGTIEYHAGELPDERMRRHGQTRGYTFDSRARQFNPKKDFDEFDYIITMDNENYSDIIALDSRKMYKDKIFKMADFISDKKTKEVPDPYYSGSEGFEYVLNLLEVGTKNLLIKIKEEIETRNKK
ncbi:MAG: low molecular weight phosphotyrosine protein phosphatase [Ignavibacteriaceae bacterium]|nr:low molecular weight phosphotyrosine protein phosphatase [Ignavibacterium sp.]MCC6253874.1 low molecular weight phosphotyrosine protein phosphatase [Ignavibacteriaceae bacterium]HMN24957.1 low molecular weight protein-tyrosine-phosphatase [Ignavibacteriaceae bacterium]HRN26498.1 low molecular weight protein-tyrosine-phosphatase [Ignavibacteriaceae bacterium]HRP92753.1 low molecular weight protein-tyrosine-phosphatase [Ignavibacteriaceae bacterium]